MTGNANAGAGLIVDDAACLIDGIDAVFADWNRGTRPGGAVAVLLRGNPLVKRCYGFGDIEKPDPFAADKQFSIASITKQFTAACILILEHQGKLSLSDEVASLLPELRHLPGAITVRHLCENSSGIRDYIGLATLAGGQLLQGLDRQLIWKIICGQQTLSFQPGECYDYSNSNFVILARIIEQLSGQTFADALQDFLFGPLAMSNTLLITDPTNPPQAAIAGYAGDIDSGFRCFGWDTYMSGEGGVWSTLDDMVVWERALIEDRIGYPGLAATLVQPGVLNTGAESCYGLGTSTGLYRGAPFEGHSGGFDGYRSFRIRFPGCGLSIIVFANHTVDPIDRALQVANLYLHDPAENVTRDNSPTSVAGIDSWLGFYQGERVGTSCEISRENDQLMLEIMGAKRTLSWQVDNCWVTGGTSLWGGYLQFDNDDPDSVLLSVAAGDRERLSRDEPDGSSVVPYSGKYYSVELDATFRLIERQEELILSGTGMAGEFGDVRLQRRGRASFSPAVGEEASWAIDIGAMLYFQDTNTLLVSTHGAVGLRFERQVESATKENAQ